jgi:hypothetical protein
MYDRDNWIIGALIAALALSVYAGFGEGGFAPATAAEVFTALILAVIAVLLHLGLKVREEQLDLDRRRKSQAVREGLAAPRWAGPPERRHLRSDIDPQLFLKPEHSLGDDSIVFILKNYGAQIWGVSMYWCHDQRTHFIDQTHPTLQTGDEIIAFVSQAELPSRFDIVVAYTRRDGSEQEERWTVSIEDGAFDCTYRGKVEGSIVQARNVV